MKTIQPSKNKHQWPRQAVEPVQCRKRDLVLRIADWTKDRDEPAYDVEIYVGGVYDFNLSASFTTKSAGRTKKQARAAAVAHAQASIEKLL